MGLLLHTATLQGVQWVVGLHQYTTTLQGAMGSEATAALQGAVGSGYSSLHRRTAQGSGQWVSISTRHYTQHHWALIVTSYRSLRLTNFEGKDPQEHRGYPVASRTSEAQARVGVGGRAMGRAVPQHHTGASLLITQTHTHTHKPSSAPEVPDFILQNEMQAICGATPLFSKPAL